MIANKLTPFFTDREEVERIKTQLEDFSEMLNDAEHKDARKESAKEIRGQLLSAFADALERYAKSFNEVGEGREAAIMADAIEIISSIDKTSYLENAKLISGGKEKRGSYSGMRDFIFGALFSQIMTLRFYDLDEAVEEIIKMIDSRAAQFYKPPIKRKPKEKGTTLPQTFINSFMPSFCSMPLGVILHAADAEKNVNRITGDVTITRDGVTATIQRYEDLKTPLGVNAYKLLTAGGAVFTQKNNKKSKSINLEVKFPLKEYAQKCGYDLEPRPTNTPEEAEKEGKRIKNATDEAAKNIQILLDQIYKTQLTWRQSGHGKNEYIDVSIIGTHGVDNGYIHMVFDSVFAQYLLTQPQTQFSVALLGVDGRNRTASYIADKMREHYFIFENVLKGTEGTLSVKTLLEASELPTIAEVRANNNSWRQRIQEPFTNALECLVNIGFLDGYTFRQANGDEIPDTAYWNKATAEAQDTYEGFEDSYVLYKIKDAPDQKQAAAAYAEKRKKVRERANAKRAKTEEKK